jgi:gentisate 1,2-dioxygenase
LFNFNDLPVIEGLGLFQSRELTEKNGHQEVQ